MGVGCDPDGTGDVGRSVEGGRHVNDHDRIDLVRLEQDPKAMGVLIRAPRGDGVYRVSG